MAPKDEGPAEFATDWHREAHVEALKRERVSYEARLGAPALSDEMRGMLESRVEQVDAELHRITGKQPAAKGS